MQETIRNKNKLKNYTLSLLLLVSRTRVLRKRPTKIVGTRLIKLIKLLLRRFTLYFLRKIGVQMPPIKNADMLILVFEIIVQQVLVH